MTSPFVRSSPALPEGTSPHTLQLGLEDKRILISGGTTGIGRATARLLRSYGARIAIYGRNEPELNDALSDLGDDPAHEVVGFIADQAELDQVESVFQQLDEAWGGLDVLINNAAVSGGALENASARDWPYIVSVNLTGYLTCSALAIERMKQNGGGHIVNVGSVSAERRNPGSSIYTATKSAIAGFSEALRRELTPDNIRVSLIEPGSVGSDMIDQSEASMKQDQRELSMMKAEDIAVAIHFCLTQSPRATVSLLRIVPARETQD